MSSIKDIAREAGVSTATVSHVINNTRFVSEDVRTRVLNAIELHKYYPNAHARSLASGSSRILGLVISDIANPFFPELVKSIETAAYEHGYDVFLSNTDYDPERASHYVRRFIERKVAGVALMTSEMDKSLVEELARREVSVVFLDSGETGLHMSNLRVCYADGIKQAILHLVELGHRNVAFISGLPHLRSAKRRLEAFLQTMQEVLPDAKTQIYQGDFKIEGGRRAASEILSAELPTAVIAANDLMAFGAISEFHRAGLNVPKDISVVGFDNIAFSSVIDPPLTTVNLPLRELGQLAVEALMTTLSNSTQHGIEIEIPTELIIRNSTAAARQDTRTLYSKTLKETKIVQKKYTSGLEKIVVALFALITLTAHMFAQKDASYTNPVQAGDYPDPSVIRVGKDYYATATSSEWGPEFPIMHSRDLVNWSIVGVVFPKRPEWSVGNYWAPEIWQENGKFYIFYVARKKDGPLCIAAATADKPTGPYTDHGALECQDAGSIDAFPIRDENGKLFVVWKEDGNSVNKPTPLWAQELDLQKWKLVGERKEILRNDPASWEANLVEGPYIIRRDGWFYMFYSGNACCGRGCNYAMGTARSKTLLGQWEKDPANPILKGNENFNCPGHGTIVTAENGRTYMMYHAYDPKDTNYVGRQALLDEVRWTKDGWATINNGKGASKSAAAPLGIAERDEEYRFIDEFDTPNLRFGWQWLQNSIPRHSITNGFLQLSPNEAQEKNPIGGIMAYYTTSGSYTATTQIDLNSLKNGSIAGISAYGDGENALGFGLQRGKIIVWRRERNNHRMLSTHDAPQGNQLYLRMAARDGIFYSFAVSRDGRTFRPVGNEQNGDYLPPWDRGVRVALTVGGTDNSSARFGFLRIEPTKQNRF